MTSNLQEQVDIPETRTDSLESILGRFISSANRTMIRLETDTLNFRREMQDFKNNMEKVVEKDGGGYSALTP